MSFRGGKVSHPRRQPQSKIRGSKMSNAANCNLNPVSGMVNGTLKEMEPMTFSVPGTQLVPGILIGTCTATPMSKTIQSKLCDGPSSLDIFCLAVIGPVLSC